MHRANAGGRQKLQREIAVADRIQRIGHRGVKAQCCGGHLPVNRERRACQGSSAQRRLVHPDAGIRKAGPIPGQHFDIGHHVMTKGHRLRHLQMGETGHHPISTGFGLNEAGLQEPDECPVHRIALITHPQPEIHRHLIIARPGRVQPARRLANQFLQPRLDIHVNVLQRGGKTESSALNL